MRSVFKRENKMPKFSVLMSVYSGEKPELLSMCLTSILDQQILPDEMIIVEDGPIGEALSRCLNKFEDKLCYKRLKLTVNVGLGKALDAGLRACTNEFVVRCDSDDYNYPERFSLLLEAMAQSDRKVAVIGSNIFEHEKNLNERIALRTFAPIVHKMGWSLRDPVAHPAVVLRRSKVLQVGGYDGPLYFEDTYLWLRLLKAGYVIQNVDATLVSMTVGTAFFNRRRGIRYALLETRAFAVFYKDNLIGMNSLCVGLLRACFRMLPLYFVRHFYQVVLRRAG